MNSRLIDENVQELYQHEDREPIPHTEGDKPFCRFAIYHDHGDRSVGIFPRTYWALAADQTGTELAELVAALNQRQPPAFTNQERIIQDVLTERRRQVHEEGYTHGHDDTHVGGELALTGAAYAILSTFDKTPLTSHAYAIWPWKDSMPLKKSRRQDLIRATGLMIAELERIDRVPEGEVQS